MAFGEPPKYPRGFKAFDWVNPDAPKGGTVYLGNPDRRTSFDKFNPFTLKGSPPTGVSILMIEALAVRSGDEPGTYYGLRGRGNAGCARQVVGHVSRAPEGALLQRRPGDWPRTSSTRSTC